jgi:hypothetical protein
VTCYINTNIMFLDIIHHPVYISEHDVSETGICLRLLSPEIGTSPIDGAQLSRSHLKMEAESSLRNGVFWNINRTAFLDKDSTMDNWNVFGGKWPWPNLRHYPQIILEGLCHCLDRGSNRVLAKYKSERLPLKVACASIIFRRECSE